MTGAAPQVSDFSELTKKSPAVRVLVVDDEPLIRWSLSETFMDRGFEVFEASDGVGAIQWLVDPARPVDVVLLDYRLPDSRDLTLLAAVRRLAPHTPVILMTAYGTPDLAEGAKDLGAYRVISKPFEMDDLADLVLQACAARLS